MNQIKTVSLVGMGALGVLFADRFVAALGEEQVTFLADDARIQRYQAQGVFCNGRRCAFSFSNGKAPAAPADLLVFAVKGTALQQAMQLAAPVVGPNTILLSLLNGIASEELLGEAFGSAQVLTCIAQGMDAVKLGNQLTYSHMGELCLGLAPGEAAKQPLLQAVTDLLDRAQVPYTIEPDILRRLWGKWMLNVGVNQVVMAQEGTYETVQQPGAARERMRAAMAEVLALAELEGIPLTQADLDGYVALIDTLNPQGMPSMRQDGLQHRATEVEFFAGTVLQKAKKHGLAVPVNEALYRQIHAMETAYLA